MTRTELIAALEAAEGPSRELDLQIQIALRRTDPSAFYSEKDDCASWHEVHGFGSTTASELVGDRLPRYTESIDSALSFTPEGMAVVLARNNKGLGSAQVFDEQRAAKVMALSQDPNSHMEKGATPAIALCIANLRALEAQEEA